MKLIGKGIRKNQDYFTALGRFVQTFAATEMVLRIMIRRLLVLTPESANVIVGSPTAQSAMETINRLIAAQKRPDELAKEYRDMTAHLGPINTNRNLILHHGTFGGDKPGEYLATNLLVARSRDSLKEIPITTKALIEMTADLDKINAHLGLITSRLYKPQAQPKERHAELMRRAWLYKLPKQVAKK